MALKIKTEKAPETQSLASRGDSTESPAIRASQLTNQQSGQLNSASGTLTVGSIDAQQLRDRRMAGASTTPKLTPTQQMKETYEKYIGFQTKVYDDAIAREKKSAEFFEKIHQDMALNVYDPALLGRGQSLIDKFKLKTLEDNNKQMVLGINIEPFKFEEIQMWIHKNLLEISAKHEETSESSYANLQYSTKFPLPENAIREQVTHSISSSGLVKITIPKNTSVDQQITIPIYD